MTPTKNESLPELFRKKPVVIEAVQFTREMAEGSVELPAGVVMASRSVNGDGRFPEHANDGQYLTNYSTCHRHYIETLEGRMDVQIGDWIIKGVKGEFYPCKPDIFAATYEAALTREAPTEAVNVGDYVPGKLDETSPARVWLQIDTTGDNDERDEEWPGAEHVTWHDESIGGLEVQYIRADLVATPPAPQSHPDALEDGSLSKSTAKRVDALLMAQGQEFQSDLRAYGVAFSRDGVRIDPSHVLICQPPHHDRGEVEQILRDVWNAGHSGRSVDFKAITAALTEAKQQGPGEVLARSWFHALPEEDDYEFHDDTSGAGKDCAGCIRAMIVPETPQVEAKRQAGEGDAERHHECAMAEVRIMPTAYGRFIVTNADETRAWDETEWRSFGGGETFATYADALRAARIAAAAKPSGEWS